MKTCDDYLRPFWPQIEETVRQWFTAACQNPFQEFVLAYKSSTHSHRGEVKIVPADKVPEGFCAVKSTMCRLDGNTTQEQARARIWNTARLLPILKLE